MWCAVVDSFVKDFAGEAGKGIITVVWQDRGMTKAINAGSEVIKSRVMAVLGQQAPQIENWMKTNAPWQDQTGNARNGLAARAYREDDEMGIILYHQVPYGIWLEVRFSGEYAIIDPALQYWGPKVMQAVGSVL
jgi:hypothetical protein